MTSLRLPPPFSHGTIKKSSFSAKREETHYPASKIFPRIELIRWWARRKRIQRRFDIIILLPFSENNNNNGQPSKVRARGDTDTFCHAVQDLPPTILPKFPDLSEDLKEPDGPNRQFIWLIDVDGVTVEVDQPEYYCLPHRPLYSKPACGSVVLSDRWFDHPPLDPQIDKCSLSNSSLCLIMLSPRNSFLNSRHE